MSDVTTKFYTTIKRAQTTKGLTQVDLAKRLRVHQPRLSEFETRLKDGNVTNQMEMLLKVAEELGYSVMLVPTEVVPEIDLKVRDFEIEQKFGSKSIFDEIFDEAAEYEAAQPSFV